MRGTNENASFIMLWIPYWRYGIESWLRHKILWRHSIESGHLKKHKILWRHSVESGHLKKHKILWRHSIESWYNIQDLKTSPCNQWTRSKESEQLEASWHLSFNSTAQSVNTTSGSDEGCGWTRFRIRTGAGRKLAWATASQHSSSDPALPSILIPSPVIAAFKSFRPDLDCSSEYIARNVLLVWERDVEVREEQMEYFFLLLMMQLRNWFQWGLVVASLSLDVDITLENASLRQPTFLLFSSSGNNQTEMSKHTI